MGKFGRGGIKGIDLASDAEICDAKNKKDKWQPNTLAWPID